MEKNEETTIRAVVDFLAECERYLHSWMCTRTGEYEPYDTRVVRSLLMELVAGGSKSPLSDFKQMVDDGKVMISTFCVALSRKYKKELYEKHCNNVKDFEEKYHIRNEENK